MKRDFATRSSHPSHGLCFIRGLQERSIDRPLHPHTRRRKETKDTSATISSSTCQAPAAVMVPMAMYMSSSASCFHSLALSPPLGTGNGLYSTSSLAPTISHLQQQQQHHPLVRRPSHCRSPPAKAVKTRWFSRTPYHLPVGGDEAVDEDEHLQLGQLVARARVHAAPERQERAWTRRHLHAQPRVTHARTLKDESLSVQPKSKRFAA